MSVIIKDMDMLKSCKSCPFANVSLYHAHGITCKALRRNKRISIETFYGERKPKRCPVKSVDGLIEEISKAVVASPSLSEDEDAKAYNQGLEVAIEIIKEYCEVKE